MATMDPARKSVTDSYTWAVVETVRRRLEAEGGDIPVVSTSMSPLARRGDIFRVVVPGGRPRFGDIVVAVAGGRAVTHRVIGRYGKVYLLKGDGAPLADAPASPEYILGRVTTLVRADGRAVKLAGARGRVVGVLCAAISRAEYALTHLGVPAPWARKFFYLAQRAAEIPLSY